MSGTLEEIKSGLFAAIRSGRRGRLPEGWELIHSEYKHEEVQDWLTGPDGKRHNLDNRTMVEAWEEGKLAREQLKARFLPEIEALANRALHTLETNRVFTWEGWDVTQAVLFPEDLVKLRVQPSALPAEILEFLEGCHYTENSNSRVTTLYINSFGFNTVVITLHGVSQPFFFNPTRLNDEELLVQSMEYIRRGLQENPSCPGISLISAPGMRGLGLVADRSSTGEVVFSVKHGMVPAELLEKLHLAEWWTTPIPATPTTAIQNPSTEAPSTPAPIPSTEAPSTEAQNPARKKGQSRHRGSRRRS